MKVNLITSISRRVLYSKVTFCAIFFSTITLPDLLQPLPPGASQPVRVTDAFGNHNSPCVLPDGRIVSLWLDRPVGTGVHELKVMAPDGSNFVVLLPDVDVLDAGIGCAP